MSKTKMRCNTCGKWFQSANAKDITCPDCVQKARKEKAAAKNAPSSNAATGPVGQGNRPAAPPPPKPKPVQSGTNQWLDSLNDIKVVQPEQPQRPKLPPSPPAPRDTQRSGSERGEHSGSSGPRPYQNDRGPGGYREGGDRGPGAYREGGNRGPGGYRGNDYRGPSAYRVGGGSGLPDTLGQRPRQPMDGGPRPGPRPGGPGGYDKPRQGGPGGKPKPKAKVPKPPPPPKPKREKIPPPPPFVPTPEQVAQIESRYLELANPTEFDGIRTQIAQELGIPKTAVKKVIKELRDRQNIPSWWEIQTYKGSEEELAKLREAYEPYLPVPPIGVHKLLSEQLSLKPAEVYQAIKVIRQQMNLPQYNDPSLHGLDAMPPKAPTAEQEEQSAPAVEVETPSDVVVTSAEEVVTPEEVVVTPAEEVATASDVVTTEDVATPGIVLEQTEPTVSAVASTDGERTE